MAREKITKAPADIIDDLNRTKDDFVLIIGAQRFKVLKNGDRWAHVEIEGTEGCPLWILWHEIKAVIRVEVI